MTALAQAGIKSAEAALNIEERNAELKKEVLRLKSQHAEDLSKQRR